MQLRANIILPDDLKYFRTSTSCFFFFDFFSLSMPNVCSFCVFVCVSVWEVVLVYDHLLEQRWMFVYPLYTWVLDGSIDIPVLRLAACSFDLLATRLLFLPVWIHFICSSFTISPQTCHHSPGHHHTSQFFFSPVAHAVNKKFYVIHLLHILSLFYFFHPHFVGFMLRLKLNVIFVLPTFFHYNPCRWWLPHRRSATFSVFKSVWIIGILSIICLLLCLLNANWLFMCGFFKAGCFKHFSFLFWKNIHFFHDKNKSLFLRILVLLINF